MSGSHRLKETVRQVPVLTCVVCQSPHNGGIKHQPVLEAIAFCKPEQALQLLYSWRVVSQQLLQVFKAAHLHGCHDA